MTIAEARAAIESLCPAQSQVQADPESQWPCILNGVDKDGNYHYGCGATWSEAWAEAQTTTAYPTEQNILQAMDDNDVG